MIEGALRVKVVVKGKVGYRYRRSLLKEQNVVRMGSSAALDAALCAALCAAPVPMPSLGFSAACLFVQSWAAPQDPPAPTISPCITKSPSRLAQCHKYLGGNLFYDPPPHDRSIYASEGRKEEIIN